MIEIGRRYDVVAASTMSVLNWAEKHKGDMPCVCKWKRVIVEVVSRDNNFYLCRVVDAVKPELVGQMGYLHKKDLVPI